MRRIGEPRWHLAALDLRLHRSRPRPRVAECQERHRRHLPGAVARLTVLLKDGKDVLAEGDRIVSSRRAALTGGDSEDPDETGGQTIAEHATLLSVGSGLTPSQTRTLA